MSHHLLASRCFCWLRRISLWRTWVHKSNRLFVLNNALARTLPYVATVLSNANQSAPQDLFAFLILQDTRRWILMGFSSRSCRITATLVPHLLPSRAPLALMILAGSLICRKAINKYHFVKQHVSVVRMQTTRYRQQFDRQISAYCNGCRYYSRRPPRQAAS